LAEAVIARDKERKLDPGHVVFDYESHEGKVSVLEPFVGKSGLAALHLLTVESLDQAEDYLIFAGTTESGEVLEEEAVRRMFTLPGTVADEAPAIATGGILDALVQERTEALRKSINERNALFFEAEADKLDGWADDLKVGLEREIKELDRAIREARRVATTALSLEDKLNGQKQVKALESERNTKRRALFDAQDDIDRQRERLIADIEDKLQQTVTRSELFSVGWILRGGAKTGRPQGFVAQTALERNS